MSEIETREALEQEAREREMKDYARRMDEFVQRKLAEHAYKRDAPKRELSALLRRDKLRRRVYGATDAAAVAMISIGSALGSTDVVAMGFGVSLIISAALVASWIWADAP